MNENVRTINISNEAEAEAFGRNLAAELKAGDVIALIGDLGTGKTTLTKAIAAGLGVTERVSSPTFTIVKEYRSGRLPLFHFDVYRLSCGEELLDAGGEEYLYGDGVSVIEWADLVRDVLPKHTRFITLSYGEQEGERVYRCTF